MEAALAARDVVGVEDFVLLEDFSSISAFVDNLRKRFRESLIYVSLRFHTAAAYVFIGLGPDLRRILSATYDKWNL